MHRMISFGKAWITGVGNSVIVDLSVDSGLKAEEDCLRFHGFIYTVFKPGMLCWNCTAYMLCTSHHSILCCGLAPTSPTKDMSCVNIILRTRYRVGGESRNSSISARDTTRCQSSTCLCQSLSELRRSTQCVSSCVH